MSDSADKHRAEAPGKLRFAIFICSTSRYMKQREGGKVEDESGDLMEKLIIKFGHSVSFRKLLPDDKALIEENLKKVLNSDVDVVVFCGGTGITSSDLTIETVSPFLEKKLPGFGEVFRFLSYRQIGSAAVLSRASAGVSRGKVLFCIPGSPEAVRLCFEKLILPEAAHIVKHARE